MDHRLNAASTLEAPRQDNITAVLEDFDVEVRRLEETLAVARSLADRVHGPIPRDASGTKDAPEHNSLLFKLKARRERIYNLNLAIQDELQRLNSGL